MDYSVKKVGELVNYLDTYKQAIENEGCASISTRISELLQAISEAQNSDEECFRKAAVAYHVDRTIHYLNAITIPSAASTANRVFNSVVKKELIATLGSDFKAPHELLVDQNQGFQAQAAGYEALASLSSYDQKFMLNSLLSALHCYLNANQGKESPDSMRIRSFLDALETPVTLIYAKQYFLAYLRNAHIPFSITNPRFIEVLQDFCRMVNASPNDETINSAGTKWIEILR